MNNIFDLLDLLIETTTITLFSVDCGENILESVDIDTAREFLQKGDFNLCSVEIENGSLCLNIEEAQD